MKCAVLGYTDTLWCSRCQLNQRCILVSHLSCGVGWAGCVHSALQSDGRDGGTVAGKPAGGMGGTDCPESGGSSPEGKKQRGGIGK